MEVNYNGRPVLKSPKITADETGLILPLAAIPTGVSVPLPPLRDGGPVFFDEGAGQPKMMGLLAASRSFLFSDNRNLWVETTPS